MTAIAVAGRPGAARGVSARPDAAVAVRRLTGSLHEPNTWTVGIVLATGIVILARHPIAHALGTEVETAPAPVAATAPAPVHSAAAPALSLPVAAAPTHAPRDPFRALVAAGASAVAAAPGATATRPASAPTPPPAPTSVTCSATHRVQPGESLWTIAGRATGSTETKRLTLAWHRVYDANRTRIGPDPSVLAVGTRLCIPAGA